MSKSWSFIPAIALGLAASLVVLAAYLLNLDEYAELRVLDLRFRYASTLDPSDKITHVNIDDFSISQLGRWPWPRQQIAQVIETLKSCGARMVAMDILFTEPQKLRYQASAEPEWVASAGDAVPLPVCDDGVLAEAIALPLAAAVPMCVQLDSGAQANSVSPALEEAFRRLLQENRQPSMEEAVRKLGASGNWSLSDLSEIYLRWRGLTELDRLQITVENRDALPIPQGPITPPLASFMHGAGATGFVAFRTDRDGLTRRVPLLAGDGSRIFPQFALILALNELQRAHGNWTLRAEPDALVAQFADGTRRVMPVDSAGRMLAHWPKNGLGLLEVPAALVAELAIKRTRLAQAPARENQLYLELLKLGTKVAPSQEKDYFELIDLYSKADQLARERLAWERESQRLRLYAPGQPVDGKKLTDMRGQENLLEGRIGKLGHLLTQPLREEGALVAFLDPAAGDLTAKKAKAAEIFSQLDALTRQTKATAADVLHLETQLRNKVEGRICLIGSTSTAAADFVPTPMNSYTPGVQVHSTVLRTILDGRFITPAPRWANVLAILLAGLAMSVLAAGWPALRSSAALLVLGTLFAAGNLYLFRQQGLWLAAVAPLAAMGSSFLVVTVYRQLTEERAKRRIKDLFSHALSPAVVDQLIEDPKLAEVGGKKSDVTLLFSDLAGFTPLSERLGPQETVKLLNRYFDRVTDIIQIQQGGYLNKFLGDGVFSFFGAPVVQADHPRRAVQAAVSCQEQVDLLNRQLRQERTDDVQLTVRMGLVSGVAMVGNYGSTQRMDYTAIGDCVNLASRLEGANKYFGTRILLADATAQRCGEGFVLRPMGEFLVVGVRQPVKVWEAIAPPQLAALGGADALPHVAQFRRAMDCLAAGQLDEATEILAKLEQLWPNDRPTKIFRNFAQEAIANRSNPAWQPDCHESKGSVQITWPWKQ